MKKVLELSRKDNVDLVELTEAVFYGIRHGLKKTKFREGSYRLVIVVGDRGNHPATKDRRGLTEQHVVNS